MAERLTKKTTDVKGYEGKKNTTIAWEKKVHQSEKETGDRDRYAECGNAKCGMAEFRNR